LNAATPGYPLNPALTLFRHKVPVRNVLRSRESKAIAAIPALGGRMLWHYRKRAEECALRIVNTKSESVRENYLRLLISWNALIAAEEERLSRVANAPQRAPYPGRTERPRLELVRATQGMEPILDRPVA
jgi:hypothetical protein